MANQEQVKRLKQGVEGWNKWRNDNPDISIDLSFANLPRADLRLADLRKAAIMSANLYGANCEKANLGGAYLISTNFR